MGRDRKPSAQMLRLLATMVSQGQAWRHGYELMKEAGLLSGTLYPLLIRMTEQGLVEGRWCEPVQPGRPPRHAYRLTSEGVALALSVTTDRGAVRAGVATA